MKQRDDLARYLPLTESTYYIMLALSRPLHGYAVMQRVAGLSRGTVAVGPGTLYGAFASLEKHGLIVKVGEERRRKIYTLTPVGNRVLEAHAARLRTMTRAAAQARGAGSATGAGGRRWTAAWSADTGSSSRGRTSRRSRG